MSPVKLLLGTYTDVVHEVLFTPPTASSAPSIKALRELPIGWGASWVVQHPKISDVFYFALEAPDAGGKQHGVEGKVQAFCINDEGAKLIGEVSCGDNPCHLEIVQDGIAIVATNYTGGSAILVPLNADGSFNCVSPYQPPNFVKYPLVQGARPMGHQAIDLPSHNQVLVLDCGNAIIWRMKLTGEGAGLGWINDGRIDLLVGNGPRQAVITPDGKQLYVLYAKSCIVNHYDLSSGETKLVSSHSILPPPHKIDLDNWQPPYILGAALTLHEASSTLTGTVRCITGEKVDSVAFFKVNKADGTLCEPTILRPKAGREYRGVGVVGNCFLVAGQEDGWMTCFEWDPETDKWAEREWESPVKFEKVVDIETML